MKTKRKSLRLYLPILQMVVLSKHYAPISMHKAYRTKQNTRPFTSSSIYDIIRNEKYIGQYIYRKMKKVRTENGYRNIPQEKSNLIILENAVPSIVDINIWQSCQERLAACTYVSNKAKVCYLMSGIIRCEECGQAFVGDGIRQRRNDYTGESYAEYHYACSGKKKRFCSNHKVNKNTIENNIINLILKAAFSQKAM